MARHFLDAQGLGEASFRDLETLIMQKLQTVNVPYPELAIGDPKDGETVTLFVDLPKIKT